MPARGIRLGQLVQGRIWAALLMFVLAGVVWFVSLGMLGWVMHLVACIEAARWKRR